MEKDIQKKLDEIDAQLAELEREEEEAKNKGKEVPRERKDQSDKALTTIEEVTHELNAIEDLKSYRETKREDYENLLLTIVSWFHYLKKNAFEDEKYEKAKECLFTVSEKHPVLSKWITELIEKPLPEYEPRINTQIEFNTSESNEYIANDDLKIVFDVEQLRDYVKKTQEGKDFNQRVLDYTIVYKEKEYPCHCSFKEYRPIWEYDPECPFRATVMNVKLDENGNPVVVFHLLTMKSIAVNEE